MSKYSDLFATSGTIYILYLHSKAHTLQPWTRRGTKDTAVPHTKADRTGAGRKEHETVAGSKDRTMAGSKEARMVTHSRLDRGTTLTELAESTIGSTPSMDLL